MRNNEPKPTTHLLRLAGLFCLVVVVFLVARHFLVPKSYGLIGRYRADAVDEEAARPVKHAGQEACKACHAAAFAAKKSGKHKMLSCESCHGPSQAHVEDPSGAKPLRPNGEATRAFCARCHAPNKTKPKGFPVQDRKIHNPGAACTECHKAHKPEMR